MSQNISQGNPNTPSAPAAQEGKGFVSFLIFIAILGAFSSLVNDMYLPTIPGMVHEFHTSPSMTQMGLSMAMIGLGIGSVLWGSLSDHYGRKPMLIYSMIVFVVATAVSLLSRSITFFIICRLFQGIGAGGGMVMSYSIPADRYQGRKLATVMALVGAINGIAPAGAPLIGGFMADSVGWRGIFVVLLVIGIITLVWSMRRPESLPPSRRIAGKGLGEYVKAYGALLRDRRFMIYVLLKAIGIGLLYAYISSATFIYQEHYGFSAMHFGMVFGANALAIALGSTLVMKFRVLKQGLIAGTVIMSIFAVVEAAVMYFALPFGWYEAAVVPMLVGCGMVFSADNSLGMEEGKADAGTASAILDVVKYIFAATVAPLVGLGDMLHSSAICFTAVAVIALLLAIPAYRLKPLTDMVKK